MGYINVDMDYFEHPKTRRLTHMLGNGTAELPIRLWIVAGKFAGKRGKLKFSDMELEAYLGWWGAAGEAVRGLVESGFLKKQSDGFSVHEWDEHNGHVHALRIRNRKAAIARWKRIKSLSGSNKKNPVSRRYQNDTTGMPHTNQPTNQTIPTKKDDIAASAAPSPFHDFMNAFLTDCLDLAVPGETKEQKASVSAAYRRYGRAGRDVLAFAGGDPERAMEGVRSIGGYLQSKNLSWTLDTIAKHFLDWTQNPEAFKHG